MDGWRFGGFVKTQSNKTTGPEPSVIAPPGFVQPDTWQS